MKFFTHTLHKKRFFLILLNVGMVTLGIFFIFTTFQENLIYFYTPSEVFKSELQTSKYVKLRIGGLVKKGSIQRSIFKNKMFVSFSITDGKGELPVVYQGILPDLFREEQGVVAEGYLTILKDGKMGFKAQQILTKHDETYMPDSLAKTLKKNGLWKDERKK